jgi:subtilisin family serine protease
MFGTRGKLATMSLRSANTGALPDHTRHSALVLSLPQQRALPMQSPIALSRVAAGILTLSLLVACADRPTEPSRVVPKAASRSTAPSNDGRYLVAARGNGFRGDFANAVASLGGTVENAHQGAGVAVVSGLSETAAARLAADAGIADVQLDQTVSLRAPAAATSAEAAGVTAVTPSSVLAPASAILYGFQWNMRAIKADVAWANGKLGDPGVTVAILDSGIDYDAFDLNGLVDVSRSTSFIASDNALRATYFPTRRDISDFNGHGTNVATQVSSKAVVLAGVTSRTTLIGVKVLDYAGNGTVGSVLNGVLWAADRGADVANMSVGGEFAKAGAGRLTSIINRVLNYANKKGMLLVVAAGNEASDLDHNGNIANAYCDMIHVVCVSATGPMTGQGAVDLPSFYTNFGRSAITVAAPGGNADAANGLPVSSWPWGADVASWVWSLCTKTLIARLTDTGVPVLTACAAGNRLTGAIGTSQAAPHVAGLAALLVSVHGRGQPGHIKHLIEKSVDDVGQPGTDPFFGRGRINVARALGF